jgi:hypothetical protein
MSSASISTSQVITPAFDEERQRAIIRRELARHSFCTLATTSSAHRPHVAAVIYGVAGEALYVSVHADSVKARNIEANPRVAVCVPIRKLPFVPPFAIQFQATAALLRVDDPEITALLPGPLKKVASHTDFDDPRSCFIRITPQRRISTYGLGVPLLQIVRDPTTAMRTVDFGSR